MAAKTFACPSCTAVNALPATDADGVDVKCVACKFPVHIDAKGKLTHEAVAPNS